MSGIPMSLIESWLLDAELLIGHAVPVGSPVVSNIETGVVDSRLAQPNSLFVALRGERTDGHFYVEHAVQRGAVAALVDQERIGEVRRNTFGSVLLIPVADPLQAVQEIAVRWRQRFDLLRRIAVTGSNGKTTTKDIITSILSRVSRTVYSHGNFNSEIGLPLELLRIRDEHRYGIFELGMNRVGEMDVLARLVDPDVAIITNIGTAHIGMLGGREQIAREKRRVFSRFTGSQVAVVPEDTPFKELLLEDVHGSVINCGAGSAEVSSVELSGLGGSVIRTAEGTIDFPLAGEHMLQNAYTAMTVARHLNVPFDAIKRGMESVTPSFGRGEIIDGEITIIQDCYNANPESMRMALSLLQSVSAAGRKVAVLGAMRELGEETDAAHRSVAQFATSGDLDEIWFVGSEFADAVGPVSSDRIRLFLEDEWSDLTDAARMLEPGDTVLLKGSRGVELERLTPVIRGVIASPAGGAR